MSALRITIEGCDQPLPNGKHEVYCIGRVAGLQKQEAYRRAGYTCSTKSLWSAISQLEKRPEIAGRVAALQKQAAEKVTDDAVVTRQELIGSIRDTREMALKGTPVLAKDGTPTDIRKPDFAAANRSNEILAKMHGFMLDVQREESLDDLLDGKTPEELREILRSSLDEVDPNLHKIFAVEREHEEAPSGTQLTDDGAVH